MGKTSKARVRKRANVANAELEAAQLSAQFETKIKDVPDDSLFTIDTTPSNKKRKTTSSTRNGSSPTTSSNTASSVKPKFNKKELSELDQRKVDKMLKSHSSNPETIISIASKGAKKSQATKRPPSLRHNTKGIPQFDLWDDSNEAKIAPQKANETALPALIQKQKDKAKKKPKKKVDSILLEVAKSGQSYNPDHAAHQDVLGEALSLELRRKDAIDEFNKPINSSMIEYMRKTVSTTGEIVPDSDSDDSDSDSDSSGSESYDDDDNAMKDGEGNKKSPKRVIKKKEKLTKAQRNKQSRTKKTLATQAKLKEHKQFLHAVNESKSIRKKVLKEEREKEAVRLELEKLKDEKAAIPLGQHVNEKYAETNPMIADSVPVALSSELKNGSLRTVVRKGDLMKDRTMSMVSRGAVNTKSTRNRKYVQGKRRRGARGNELLQLGL